MHATFPCKRRRRVGPLYHRSATTPPDLNLRTLGEKKRNHASQHITRSATRQQSRDVLLSPPFAPLPRLVDTILVPSLVPAAVEPVFKHPSSLFSCRLDPFLRPSAGVLPYYPASPFRCEFRWHSRCPNRSISTSVNCRFNHSDCDSRSWSVFRIRPHFPNSYPGFLHPPPNYHVFPGCIPFPICILPHIRSLHVKHIQTQHDIEVQDFNQ